MWYYIIGDKMKKGVVNIIFFIISLIFIGGFSLFYLYKEFNDITYNLITVNHDFSKYRDMDEYKKIEKKYVAELNDKKEKIQDENDIDKKAQLGDRIEFLEKLLSSDELVILYLIKKKFIYTLVKIVCFVIICIFYLILANLYVKVPKDVLVISLAEFFISLGGSLLFFNVDKAILLLLFPSVLELFYYFILKFKKNV